MGTCTSKYKTPTRSLSLTSRLISIPSPPSPPPSQVFFAPQLLHDYWVALFETQKRTEPFTLATPNRVADYCKATGNRPPPSFNPPSSTAPSASALAMRAMVVAADLVSNGGTVGGAVGGDVGGSGKVPGCVCGVVGLPIPYDVPPVRYSSPTLPINPNEGEGPWMWDRSQLFQHPDRFGRHTNRGGRF